MAKTSALTTLKPERFSTQAEIYFDEVTDVVEMQNYAAQYFPQTHVALTCAPSGWETSAPQGLSIEAPLTLTTRRALRFAIQLHLETQEVLIGARMFCATGEEVDLHVTLTPDLGAGTPITDTLSFDDTTNGTEQTVLLDVTGVGVTELESWVTVDLETTTAAAGVSYLRTFRCEDAPLSTLPSPRDE